MAILDSQRDSAAKLVGIVGAGGFGREVMEYASALAACGAGQSWDLVFVERASRSDLINGRRVIAEDEFLKLRRDKWFCVAIADSILREAIAIRMQAAGVEPITIMASTSVMLSGSIVGVGATICPFALISANVVIGRYFHANVQSYVAHDCVIGDFVTFAPGVICNGGVIIKDHAYVGAGAVIRNSTEGRPIIIGQGAVIGMGAVVTKSVDPFVTVVGNPAHILSRGVS